VAPSPTVDAEAVTVRRATRPDLLSIHRLEKRVFDEPWSYAVFEEFLGESAFLVAELDGRLLGYVVADRTPNNGRDFGHVKDLAVDPEVQRNGIGRLLLRGAVSRLLVDGVVRIKLEVREHNTAARQLYVQEGFEPRKRIPRYYHDGEAALVLVYEMRQ